MVIRRYRNNERNRKDIKINPIIITGIIALLGTVTGGIIEGYMGHEQSKEQFKSNLIINALKADNAIDRVASLKFLMDAGLISDPKYTGIGLDSLIKEPSLVPQFIQTNSTDQILESAEKDILEKYPTLMNKTIALVGFKIRHGYAVEAITPIYAEVLFDYIHYQDTALLDGCYMGNKTGGNFGIEQTLIREGHVVSALEITYGIYGKRYTTIQMKVVWKCLQKSSWCRDSVCISETMGKGLGSSDTSTYTIKVGEDSIITDIKVTTTFYTENSRLIDSVLIAKTAPIPKLKI